MLFCYQLSYWQIHPTWFDQKHLFKKETCDCVCEWVTDSFIKKCRFIEEQNTNIDGSFFFWQSKNKQKKLSINLIVYETLY